MSSRASRPSSLGLGGCSTHLAFSSHRNANVLFAVDGDTATGIVDYAVDTRMTPDGTWVCGTGTYTDDHARRNGQWTIVRRTAPFFERLPHSTVRG